MTTPRDLTPFLDGLPLDFLALEDARAFARDLPTGEAVHARLEDFLMCFVHFTKTTTATTPGQVEALHVFRFAVSGLWALLEGQDMAAGWGTLARARLWAVGKYSESTAYLPFDTVQALHLAINGPHLLPAWGKRARQDGHEKEAGRAAAWLAVAHLLEAAPRLEDGEAEELTAATLEALAPGLSARFPLPPLTISTGQPAASSSSPEGVPGLSDFVPTVQSVAALEGGRVRLEVQGGEGYEVRREDCTYTPLPDSGALLMVFVGTPDAAPLRLPPEEARQVFDLLAFDEAATTDPRLN